MFVGPGTIPVGGIIMWSGSADAIPEGWALCDGQNGTPNLSGKFVVGYDPSDADYNSVGKSGGAATVKLTTDQMPKHTHKRSVRTVGLAALWNDCQQVASFERNGGCGRGEKNNGDRDLGESSSAGGDQPHENRPPFFVICYIMRVK
jgi:microcystin-dependent protein